MKLIITLFIVFTGLTSQAQQTAAEIAEHRAQHLKDLLDTNNHMMNNEEIEAFQGLDYFDFDSSYRVEVKFTKDKGKKFEMPTSTARLPIYRRYGYIDFMIDTVQCRLTVYQSMSLKGKKEYKKYLFIPYKDKTTRNETYGGGRFIDFEIPDGEISELDFNLTYNPYCAYSHRYSCPIPPEENTLNVEIKAGEKTPLGH